jgi:nucleotide-binding universal stress UspA family protein
MYQKIMVPLDGSKLAECVLPHVESLAKACVPRALVFVCVVEPPEFWHAVSEADTGYQARKVLDEQEQASAHNLSEAKKYLDDVASRTHLEGVSLQTEVISGQTEQSLIQFAETQGVDLVVIATHGRSGPSRWVWGSVADRVLRGTCVPVLMVRAPGCVAGI